MRLQNRTALPHKHHAFHKEQTISLALSEMTSHTHSKIILFFIVFALINHLLRNTR